MIYSAAYIRIFAAEAQLQSHYVCCTFNLYSAGAPDQGGRAGNSGWSAKAAGPVKGGRLAEVAGVAKGDSPADVAGASNKGRGR